MTSRIVQPRFAPEAEFRYVSGDVSLDLINTVDWTERGLESDRLTSYHRLLEWARGAAVVRAREERRLREQAGEHPRRAAAALGKALEARDVLQRVFTSAARNRVTARDPVLDEFNGLLAATAPHLRIVREPGGRLGQGWAGFGESFDLVRWAVVWAAAELLSSTEIAQVRVCAGVDCGWLYVDRSRNGLRRWCEMAVCGTAAKNRRRSQRRPQRRPHRGKQRDGPG